MFGAIKCKLTRHGRAKTVEGIDGIAFCATCQRILTADNQQAIKRQAQSELKTMNETLKRFMDDPIWEVNDEAACRLENSMHRRVTLLEGLLGRAKEGSLIVGARW